MIVVIAKNLPPAVRGRLKLWFLEPKPNVFISGVKDSVAMNVVDYLYEHCPQESSVTIFQSTQVAPGFVVKFIGPPSKKIITLSGLQVFLETVKTE